MSKISDQTYLKGEQYKTSSNLEARLNLHRRFSTNTYDWHRWVLDQLELQPGTSLLEIGCGPASLWRENLARVPEDTKIVLGDLSSGMVMEARQILEDGSVFAHLGLDVQAVPFPDESFDVVVANHMLYHVPDISLGLEELARVMRPGGIICAATNGSEHMHQMSELLERFKPGFLNDRKASGRFTLENAPGILWDSFQDVEVRRFDADLVVTEVEPLIAYVRSMWDLFGDNQAGKLETLREELEDWIAVHGSFDITKSQGVVMGVKGAAVESRVKF